MSEYPTDIYGNQSRNVRVMFLDGSKVVTAAEDAWKYEQRSDWLRTEEIEDGEQK